MPYENWCKHFNGLINNHCEAGVAYATVKDAREAPYQYPCFADNKPATVCELQTFPTAEECAAYEAEVRASIERYMGNIAAHVCPVCHQPIDSYRQIGRCVYVSPCGDRIYQGKLSAAMLAHNQRERIAP